MPTVITEHPFHPSHLLYIIASSESSKDYHGSASSLVGGKGTSIGKLMEQDERNAESKIEYFDHEHPLCFKKVAEQNGSAICKACFLEISDEAYACKSCKYYIHKACTNLPWEVLHPLHPHHSLKLLSEVRGKVFSCDGCRDVTAGFAYACSMCGFMLDVKCALLRVPKIETQRLKETEERRPKSCLLNKAYQLSFFNIKAIFDECCSFCQRYVKGPAYSCSDCDEEEITAEGSSNMALDFPSTSGWAERECVSIDESEEDDQISIDEYSE
ncbi:uncharacterized protein LOC105782827 [Gossypium raimondii]|uniref:uncharacterized protein LOC105782827 n=1 Tax=Gossypium raimondii TaxID=29730 RepID=UPI00227D32E0|nr:uncharacterized protein LOC105782827 [Gossypium raimondii]